AMVGARMREMYVRQAKERMSQGGGDKKSQKAKSGKENLPDPIPAAGQSRDKAGELVGVSGRTMDFATKVARGGVPELIEAVEAGGPDRAAEGEGGVRAWQVAGVAEGEREVQSTASLPLHGTRQS